MPYINSWLQGFWKPTLSARKALGEGDRPGHQHPLGVLCREARELWGGLQTGLDRADPFVWGHLPAGDVSAMQDTLGGTQKSLSRAASGPEAEIQCQGQEGPVSHAVRGLTGRQVTGVDQVT